MSASKIPPSEWEKHRQVIHNLYVDKKLPLDALVKEMETVHGFIATKSQYIRKLASWKIGKNTTTSAWKKAAVLINKRKREGKESEIYIDGKPIPSKKMKREIARHGPSYLESIEMKAHEIDLPGGFVVQTPPATTFQPIQPHRWKMQLDGLPWMKFRDGFMPHSTLFAGPGFDNAPMDLITNIIVPTRNLTTITTASQMVQHYDRISPTNLSDRFATTDDSLGDGSWTCFILCFAYFVSNNLLESKAIKDVLDWIDGTRNAQIIKAFFQLKGLTIESCTSALFSGAVCNGLSSIVQLFLENGYDPDTSPHSCYLRDGSTMLDIAIEKGNIAVIRLLLGANPNLIRRGGNPLRLAIKKRNDAVIKILLENGADPNNAQDIGESFLASYVDGSCDEDILRLLLKAGARIDGESIWSVIHTVPLVKAAHRYKTQVARFLLDEGANVNEVDTHLGSAIQAAVKNNDMKMVKLLVEAGADVNLNTYRYGHAWSFEDFEHNPTKFFSPLQLATKTNNSEMIQYLLQKKADPNHLLFLQIIYLAPEAKSSERGYYETPLSYAVLGGNLHIAKLLLDAGANPNAGYLHGHTALGAACREENLDMVKLFLDNGATPQSDERPGLASTPLQLAILHKDLIFVDNLIQRGADINAPPCNKGGTTALQAAAVTGNASLFKRLLDLGANINAPAAAEKGVTCLQAAMLSGNDEIIEMIVNYGGAATMNSILCAVKIRSCKMVDLLMGLGADVNTPGIADLGPNHKGYLVTPLVLAVYNKDIDMIQKLLLLGASVSHIHDEIGSILPLHQAIRTRDLRITELLLSAETDPNQVEPFSGETGLGIATSHLYGGREDLGSMAPIVRELINHNANVNLMAKGIYPIENVLMSDELMKIFIEAGADIHAKEGSLLPKAICAGSSATRLLLDNDVNVNGQDKHCGTPLQAAITIGDFDLVLELFARGANVNADPNSLVAYAVELELPRIVELLLEQGANTQGISPSKDNWCYHRRERSDPYVGGRTALVAAAEQNNFDLVKALIKRGANVEADNAQKGSTRLQAASINHDFPLALRLVDYVPNGWRSGLRTALQAASQNRNLQLARLLIERGAKVNMKTGTATALQLAAMNGDIQMAVLLLENGAKINAPGPSSNGRTALEGAAEHGRLDMIYLLLQNDQDETGLEVRCQKAANYAEDEGHSEIAKVLREWRQR